MNNIINENVLKILRPLVRVMIRNGVSSGSYEELVRKAYVDEAFAMGKKSQQNDDIQRFSTNRPVTQRS